MKKIGMLVVGTLLVVLSACEKKVNCEMLTNALLHYDQEKAKTEINNLCTDLKPHGQDRKKTIACLLNRKLSDFMKIASYKMALKS